MSDDKSACAKCGCPPQKHHWAVGKRPHPESADSYCECGSEDCVHFDPRMAPAPDKSSCSWRYQMKGYTIGCTLPAGHPINSDGGPHESLCDGPFYVKESAPDKSARCHHGMLLTDECSNCAVEAPDPDKSACAKCGHAMSRHDPEDGNCEAPTSIPGDVGVCPCPTAFAPAPDKGAGLTPAQNMAMELIERQVVEIAALRAEVERLGEIATQRHNEILVLRAAVEREHKRATEPPIVTRELARAREGRDKAEAQRDALREALASEKLLWMREAHYASDRALAEKARADKAEAEVERLTRERDETRRERRSCPICHGDPFTFRSGNQGYGEEDFDINSCRETKWKDGRLVHHCHERCLRVDAEARVATLEKAIRGVLTHFTPEHLDAVSNSTCGTEAHAALEAK